MRKIYDISPTISENSPVWPGDQEFSRKIMLRLEDGESVNLASILTTVHIGAHADAPLHYIPGSPSIDQVDLQPYLGECEVVTARGPQILAEHCQAAVKAGRKRILFRTESFDHSQKLFKPDFTYFSREAVQFMGEHGVKLIGIDTPSVDAFSSKELPVHHELWRWQMRNLECLQLAHVSNGAYELIALPLKMFGLDASPVRAILRDLP